MDALDVASIAWVSFDYTVLCPILLYFLYKFSKINKSENMMKYRSKKLVVIINVLMLIILIFERLYTNSASIWRFWIFEHVQINWIFYAIWCLLWWTVFILFAIKVFHLYYKQQHCIAIKDVIWKKEINRNAKNWFISNKHKWGKPIYCVKYMILPFMILIGINTSILYIINGKGFIVNLVQYFIPMISVLFSLTVFYMKSKTMKDVYFIRNEILYQCIIIIIALLIYLCIFLYFYLFNIYITSENTQRMEWLFRNLVANILVIGLALISTAYPVYIHHYQYHLITKQVPRNTNKFSKRYSEIHAIKQILSTYDSYKLFMEHLVSEFCPESLFFVTELIMIKYQYQQNKINHIDMTYMIQKYSMPRDDDDDMDGIYSYLFDGIGAFGVKLTISTKVPMSEIVINNKNNLKQQMIDLYNKYIRNYCENEVNVSSKTKRCLLSIFENENELNKLTEYELFNIFDNAGIEVLNLLKAPFHRFANGALFDDSFGDLCNINHSKQKNNKPQIISMPTIKDEILTETPGLFKNKYNDNLSTNVYKVLDEKRKSARNLKPKLMLNIHTTSVSMDSL